MVHNFSGVKLFEEAIADLKNGLLTIQIGLILGKILGGPPQAFLMGDITFKPNSLSSPPPFMVTQA